MEDHIATIRKELRAKMKEPRDLFVKLRAYV
jgi:hypothetical protein